MGEAHWRLVTPCPPVSLIVSLVTDQPSPPATQARGPSWSRSSLRSPGYYSLFTPDTWDTGTRDNVTRLRWEREWADTGDWRAGAACGHSEQEPGGDTEPPWEARWAEHGDMWSDNPANGKKIRPSLIKWKYIPLPSGQLIFGAILVIKTIKIRMMAFNLLGPRFQTDPLEPSDPRISYCWFYHSMPI